MAEYYVTQTDIDLLNRNLRLHLQGYLLNENNQTVDTLEGVIISGDGTDDASSDVRKSCNFVIYSLDSTYDIGEYNRIWLKNRVRIDIGLEDVMGEIHWYTKGTYVFDSCSYTYDGSTKELSFQCSDLVSTINGTHNGLIFGECDKCGKHITECEHRGRMFSDSILIEGCTLNEKTGLYEGNDIKKVVEDLLLQNGIKEFRISSVGQVSCLQGYAVNWKQNRIDTGSTQEEADRDEKNGYDDLANDHGTWHMIPYDLEFNNDATLWEILTKIRDLYSGYEMFFDKDGVFVFQLIPICHHDLPVLDHTQIEKLVINENSDYDLTTVRNATYVYGQSIETDRFAESCKFTDVKIDGKSVHSIKPSLSNFTFKGNIVIGLVFPEISNDKNSSPAYITLNDETYPIVMRKTSVVEYEKFSERKKYKINDCCTYDGVVYTFVAEKPVGKWDSSVVMRLTTSNVSSNVSNIVTYPPMNYSEFNNTDMYCFKYLSTQKLWVYAGMYQIQGYYENNDSNSPFAIDKIGYRPQILQGGDYENIPTSTLATERAEYETWLVSRLTDTLTIETVIIPFLEVNQKISYKKMSDNSIDSYIIKNLSYSFTGGTMTITMCKFYELDPFIVCS